MKTADLREIEVDFYNRCRCEYFDAIFLGVEIIQKEFILCFSVKMLILDIVNID